MGGGGTLEEAELECGPVEWPDTDSELGDYTAPRATWFQQPGSSAAVLGSAWPGFMQPASQQHSAPLGPRACRFGGAVHGPPPPHGDFSASGVHPVPHAVAGFWPAPPGVRAAARGPEESEFECGPMDWPDTDSEFGDYAAPRATWFQQPGRPAAGPGSAWPGFMQPASLQHSAPLGPRACCLGAAHGPPPPPGDFSASGVHPHAVAGLGPTPTPSARAVARGPEETDRAARGSESGSWHKVRKGRKARMSLAESIKSVSCTISPDRCTTVMVRNLRQSLSQQEFAHELDQSGFAGMYDFCYLPCNFDTGANKGFAFVNFSTPAAMALFKRSWHGMRRFPLHNEGSALQVTTAHIQGYEANKRMALSMAACTRNPGFRRIVRPRPTAQPRIAGGASQPAAWQREWAGSQGPPLRLP